MNGSTIITMLVGLVIPGLIALITRAAAPTWLKAALVLLCTTASGILSGVLTTPPKSISDWEHIAINILMTFIAAVAGEVAQKSTGVKAKVVGATARFGLTWHGREDVAQAA